ncbi:hypothetical protein DK389_15910 [Methylobacterium durans]|uniref:Tandem-95 repeat protein n=2 Tax=Methylobacterium durans TaxID=2202825 RepID=A0A2U8W8T0_9HYPH|nr:hypothetical protein DK389_15910 [Methylobacterium durans]
MAGDDRINAGSGDDIIDGGAGNDTLKGDAGDDLAIYVAAENRNGATSFTDIYDGGSGKDTVRLVLTRAEWMNPALQLDIANYLAFLAKNTNSANGEANNTEFRFTAFDLRVSKFETLQVMVDGVFVDPRDEAVTLRADAVRTNEDSASIAVDVLANDSVPDLIKSLAHTQPGHGTVQLVLNLADPSASASAKFVYTPDPKHWQYLAVGETATDTFTYTVTDADGDVQTQTVTVTIEGRNDAPVITSAAQSGAVDEKAEPGEGGTLSASGTIAFKDVDLSDDHTAAVTAREITGSSLANGYSLTAAQQAALKGAFAVGAAPSSSVDGTGSVAWRYDVADATLDFLGAQDSVTLVFSVLVDDGHGGTASQDVTVTVTGTNDQPVIASGALGGSVDEKAEPGEGGTLSAAGAISFSDADLSDDHSASVASRAITATSLANGYSLTADQQAALMGAFSIGPAPSSSVDGSGSIAWTYALADSALDFLGADDSVTLTFKVLVDDGQGGTAHQDVTVTVTGTNDQPVITSAAQTGAVDEKAEPGEGGVLSAKGTISFSDADLSDDHTATVTSRQIAGITLANGYSLTAAQETALKDAFSVGPAPSSAVDGTGSIAWSYDVADTALDFLGANDSATLTFTVLVADGHGGTASQTVAIIVTGTNDQPIVTSDEQVGAVDEKAEPEEGGTLSAGGTITFSDTDLSDEHAASVLSRAITATSLANGYSLTADQQAALTGAFSIGPAPSSSIDGSGSVAWTYAIADGALDFLGANDSVTLTFGVRVDDGHGGTVDQDVTVTVTGTNDQPVVAAGASASLSELAQLTNGVITDPIAASGVLSFADADLSDRHTVSQTLMSVVWSGGSAVPAATANALASALSAALADDSTADGSGSIGWSFSLGNPRVDFLAAGETLTLTYNVTVTDDAGATDTKPVVVTITGANDFPIVEALAGDTVHTVLTETDACLKASGTVTVTDRDLTDVVTVSVSEVEVLSGSANGLTLGQLKGFFSVSPTQLAADAGSANNLAWAFDSGSEAFNYLAVGETLTLKYSVAAKDDSGSGNDTGVGTVVVVVAGTNDGPVLAADPTTHALTEIVGATGGSGTQAATATLAFTDADLTDTHGVTSALSSATWSNGTIPAGTAAALADALTLTTIESANTGSGSVKAYFSLADQLVDFLSAEETLTVTYNVTVTDTQNATSTKPVTFTITGTNDNAVLTTTSTGSDQGSVVEDGLVVTSGSLSFTDADLKDMHTVSVGPSSANALGVLTAEITADASGAGSVAWHYAVDNAKIQSLAEGEAKVETFQVRLSDGLATVTKDVSVTITGTNDAPMIVAASTTATGSVTEIVDNAAGENIASRTATGVIAFADVDTIDTHSANVTSESTGYLGSLTLNSVDQAGNSVGWMFSVPDSALDGLAAGQTRTQTYNVTVSDGRGGTATQAVTVTITGTNDAPVVTGPVTGSATEDGAVSTLSALANATDVDAGTTLSVANVPGSLPAGVSYNAATQSFTLDPGVAAYQSLAVGETKTVSVSYGVSDGIITTPATVSWTVTGTNDAPVAELDFVVINEDGPSSAGNVLRNDTDIDTGDRLQVTSVRLDPSSGSLRSAAAGTMLQGELGTLTIHADGSYLYALDNSNPFIQGLSADASTAEQFLYTARDSAGAQTEGRLTVSIRGQNDAPVVSGVVTGAAVEDGASSTLAALARASDVDRGTKLAVVDVPADLPAGVTYNAAAQSFTLDPSASVYQSLAAGQTTVVAVNYGVSDGIVTTAASASWTVTGTNDAPTIVAASTTATGAVTERADKSATENALPDHTAGGTISFADVDTLDTHSATVTAQGSGYLGSLSLGSVDQAANSVGWTFSVADSALDFLSAGETRVQNYTVAVADGIGGVANQTITVTITGAADNTPPVAVDDNFASSSVNTAGFAYNGVNGHYYKFVDGGYTFVQAQAAAAASGGYLATVTSAQENSFIFGLTAGAYAWLGGSDAQTEGQWRWVSGPETGTTFWNGGTNGSASSGQFANWQPGTEPNNLGDEDHVHMWPGGYWNDSNGASPFGYVIEIGGRLGDPDQTITVSENGSVQIGAPRLLANDSDADQDPLAVTAVSVLSERGATVTLSGDVITYTPRNADELSAGQVVEDTFTYTISDGQGGSDTATVRLTVSGTNDLPVIVASSTTATGSVTERADGSATENTLPNHTADGTIRFTDVDTLDTHTAIVTPGALGYLGNLILRPLDQSSDSVGWTFSVADSALDSLAAGQTKTQSYTVTVSDGKGGVANQAVTITITGTNDAPTIVASGLPTTPTGQTVRATTPATLAALTIDDATGAVYVAEQDTVASLFKVIAADGSVTQLTGDLTGNASGNGFFPYVATDIEFYQGGIFCITSDGRLVRFDVATRTTQVLTALSGFNIESGMDITSDGRLLATDGAGTANRLIQYDIATRTITKTILNLPGDSYGVEHDDVTGRTFFKTSGGQLFEADLASGTYKLVRSDLFGNNFEIAPGADRAYIKEGSTWVQVDLVTGSRTTVATGIAGDSGEAQFGRSSDGTGSSLFVASGTQVVEVKFGSSSVSSGKIAEIADKAVGENTTIHTAGGTIAFADVDAIDVHTAAVTPQGSGYLGSLTLGTVDQLGDKVSWTFSVADSTLDSLAAGQTKTQSYTVAVSDGHGGITDQTVTVAITGANDAPVVLGAVTGAATEDGATVTLDALANASDPDSGTSLSVVNIPASLPGGVTYDAATHSFTLNPAHAAYQSLAAGEAATVSVAYGVSDGIAVTPASVSWTVAGTNEAPTGPIKVLVIGGASSSAVNVAAQLNDDTYFDFDATAVSASAYANSAAWADVLKSYEVVVMGDSGFNDASQLASTGVFAAVRGFAEHGGDVVTTGWYDYGTMSLSAQNKLDADYISPIGIDSTYAFISGSYSFNVVDPSHPMMKSISNFTELPPPNNWEIPSSVDPSAVVLATVAGSSSNGTASNPAVLYSEPSSETNLVYIGGLYMASAQYGLDDLRTGVHDRLLEQAVAWAADRIL